MMFDSLVPAAEKGPSGLVIRCVYCIAVTAVTSVGVGFGAAYNIYAGPMHNLQELYRTKITEREKSVTELEKSVPKAASCGGPFDFSLDVGKSWFSPDRKVSVTLKSVEGGGPRAQIQWNIRNEIPTYMFVQQRVEGRTDDNDMVRMRVLEINHNTGSAASSARITLEIDESDDAKTKRHH